MNSLLVHQRMVNTNLDQQKFSIFKQIVDYQHSQLQSQAAVTKNNLWPEFKLWPVQAREGLLLFLPEGTQCQSCKTSITGQFSERRTVETLRKLLRINK